MSTAVVEVAVLDKNRAYAICAKIRENMTSARDLLVELYEGRGWEALGYASWRECAAAEFGEHERTLYRQLAAAKVARELAAGGVFDRSVKNPASDGAPESPADIPDTQLVALARAPKGTRAEVLRVAAEAAGGRPTEKTVRAAVAAKRAEPEASAEALVETVKAAVAPEPNAIVNGVPAYDEGVARLQAAGRIPAGVQVTVDAPAKAEPAAAPAVATTPAESPPPLSDDDWLATLPLSSKLTGVSLKRFRIDSLLYRDIEDLRRRIIPQFSEARNRRLKGSAWKGSAVAAAVSWWFRMEHPKDWDKCPPTDKGGCDGTGAVPVIGGDCLLCKGRGYLAR